MLSEGTTKTLLWVPFNTVLASEKRTASLEGTEQMISSCSCNHCNIMYVVFAWEAYEHGNDIHPLADPTKLEIMHKEFKVKKDDFQTDQKEGILERYGGAEHLEAPPRELLLAQTEEYVEYSRSGNVVRGQERAVAKSRYEEDVYTNNHTVSYVGCGAMGYGLWG